MHPTESQKVPRSFKAWWKMLGRSIYEGDRLKANLKAITAVSLFSAALGLGLLIMNLLQSPVNGAKVAMSLVTVAAGGSCACFCTLPLGRRR